MQQSPGIPAVDTLLRVSFPFTIKLTKMASDNHSKKDNSEPTCDAETGVMEETSPQQLRREFKPRQINMLAIAGALATGLIIGSGTGLSRGGPASLFIAYVVTGAMIFFIMTALGEMAAFLPMDRVFNGYASRFVDPALG